MPTLPRSKPSTGSAIDTANAEPETASHNLSSTTTARSAWRWNPLAGKIGALASGARRRPWSPLTGRILAVNVLALAILAGGFLYLGKYQASLVDQQIESLKTEARIFAAALGEGAVLDSAGDGQVLLPDLARQMMR